MIFGVLGEVLSIALLVGVWVANLLLTQVLLAAAQTVTQSAELVEELVHVHVACNGVSVSR